MDVHPTKSGIYRYWPIPNSAWCHAINHQITPPCHATPCHGASPPRCVSPAVALTSKTPSWQPWHAMAWKKIMGKSPWENGKTMEILWENQGKSSVRKKQCHFYHSYGLMMMVGLAIDGKMGDASLLLYEYRHHKTMNELYGKTFKKTCIYIYN